VGILIYLTATTPDLSYVVSFLSRFVTMSMVEHWTATKGVLRYVKGILDFGVLYNKSKDARLCGYSVKISTLGKLLPYDLKQDIIC
jgi:hypothetical protein